MENVTPIKFRDQKKRRSDVPVRHGMDFPLFFTVCAIALFGIVMLFSASYYKALSESGNVLGIVKNQILYLAAGIFLMFVVSLFDYKLYKNFRLLLGSYILVLLLLGATAIFGRTVLGAKRWLYIGPFGMQPSELVKFVLVLCIAYYMSTHSKNLKSFVLGPVFILLMLVPPGFLIYKQPNMSMLILLVVLTTIMLFIGGVPWKHIFILAAIAALVIVAVLIIMLVKRSGADYRQSRFDAWRDPFADPSGKSYQVVQSLFAFANGGFKGQGFNMSRQKLLFLPEMENDYILAIIAEELGFIGVFLLLCAYAFVIYRGIRIALAAQDRFGGLIAAGITCALALQVIINVAVVTNTIPATGQSLPFISAGGSSLLVFFGAIGILLNISRSMTVKNLPLFGKRAGSGTSDERVRTRRQS